MGIAQRLVAWTPTRFQDELKRLYYGRQIRRGKFVTTEPEYEKLSAFVSDGDWVIDVGANVGHYTVKLSELVGSAGRVISFEPIPTTFTLLSENVLHCEHSNITLVNAAASDNTSLVGMSIPDFSSGRRNYYRASICPETSNTNTVVMSFPIDNLQLEHRISLIKIDAEGHEPEVLRGAKDLIERDRPILIIEAIISESRDQLLQLGYTEEHYPNSPNTVFRI